MTIRFNSVVLLAILLLHGAASQAQVREWEVGLTGGRQLIRAYGVDAGPQSARTVVVLAGLRGNGSGSDDDDSEDSLASSERARTILNQYGQLPAADRMVNLIVIPSANPEAEQLQFPPTGRAYAEQPVAHALWRWLGVQAPDLIIADGPGSEEFEVAAEQSPLAGIGTVPVLLPTNDPLSTALLNRFSELERSPARLEIQRRLSRSPAQLARQLASQYGHDFSTPAYVPGMGLIGRLRLGEVDDVQQLLAPYLAGLDIAIDSSSVLAGQLVFAEYAERTGNPEALELTVKAADLAFDEQGDLLDAMPFHYEMSDAVFMAPPLLTRAGKLTGNDTYFDMVARHVRFMQRLLLRTDGLYRHSPLADVAWGRGNAFPVLGLALVLSDFPQSHPAYPQLMNAYLAHLESLRAWQRADGLWRQVIDVPGSFAELSATAMLGIAIKRGLDRGWLATDIYQPVLDKIWQAVQVRTGFDGVFIDVCTSTGKLDSLEAYLDRLAILDRDDRAGGMVMNLAVEMMAID